MQFYQISQTDRPFMWLKKYLEKNFLTIYRGRDGVPKKPDPTKSRVDDCQFTGGFAGRKQHTSEIQVDLATGHAAKMQTILVSGDSVEEKLF